MSCNLSPAQRVYAKDASSKGWDNAEKEIGLLSVIRKVKPKVLIGTSTVRGAFTEEIVRAMAAGTTRPVIFPLSNPTSLHEAVPADILAWTDGKALVATGSPFEPVKGPWGPRGREVEMQVAECNNSVVFPGIGLGAVLCRASKVTDGMLVAAVRGVAEMAPAVADGERSGGGGGGAKSTLLLPGVDVVREVSVRVARRVVQAAVREGVDTQEGIPDIGDVEGLDEWIREQMWNPEYRDLKPVMVNDDKDKS